MSKPSFVGNLERRHWPSAIAVDKVRVRRSLYCGNYTQPRTTKSLSSVLYRKQGPTFSSAPSQLTRSTSWFQAEVIIEMRSWPPTQCVLRLNGSFVVVVVVVVIEMLFTGRKKWMKRRLSMISICVIHLFPLNHCRCLSTEPMIASVTSSALLLIHSPSSHTNSTGFLVVCLLSVILLAFVVCIVVVRFRRFFCRRCLPSPPESIRRKKRVVIVLQSNSLYASSSHPQLPPPAGSGKQSAGSVAPLVVPVVRIEAGGKMRMASDVVSVSEYEIPLDRDWEIPRNK